METKVTCNGKPLHLHLKYCNHSPTGYDWGYNGSGPAQLAFEILYKYFLEFRYAKFAWHEKECAAEATRLHQLFKNEVISRLPRNVGGVYVIDAYQIQVFLEEHKNA